MGAAFGLIAFIVVIVVIAWLPQHFKTKRELQEMDRLTQAGRVIRRPHRFETDTVVLRFTCGDPNGLLQRLQAPGYLTTTDYSVSAVTPSEFLIHCRSKPKWDAIVSLDTASGDQCVLKFTFIKWAYGSLLERRNEFRTVIERTVLQIDPGAEIATSMNKLENGLLKGVGGMLDVALHNAMADSQGDQLNFTSLADLYQSAPAFREHWN